MVVSKDRLVHGGTTGKVIGVAMEVHSALGPGFLESVYEEALAFEFKQKHMDFERQKRLNVFYKGNNIKEFICDFLVDGKVIVELKAIKETGEIDKIQLLSYLKASKLQVGLLMNFGKKSLDYHRLINTNPRNL